MHAARAIARNEVLTDGSLRLELGARKAYLGCLEVPLAAREFDVLSALLSNRGRVVTRESLGAEGTRSVDAAVGALRRKLGGFGRRIRSVHRLGYFVD